MCFVEEQYKPFSCSIDLDNALLVYSVSKESLRCFGYCDSRIEDIVSS